MPEQEKKGKKVKKGKMENFKKQEKIGDKLKKMGARTGEHLHGERVIQLREGEFSLK